MLVLNLKEGDYILIGDEIQVYFEHKTGRDNLELTIDAPKEITVLRGKLYEKALEEKAASGDEAAKALVKKLKKERTDRARKPYTTRPRTGSAGKKGGC